MPKSRANKPNTPVSGSTVSRAAAPLDWDAPAEDWVTLPELPAEDAWLAPLLMTLNFVAPLVGAAVACAVVPSVPLY